MSGNHITVRQLPGMMLISTNTVMRNGPIPSTNNPSRPDSGNPPLGGINITKLNQGQMMLVSSLNNTPQMEEKPSEEPSEKPSGNSGEQKRKCFPVKRLQPDLKSIRECKDCETCASHTGKCHGYHTTACNAMRNRVVAIHEMRLKKQKLMQIFARYAAGNQPLSDEIAVKMEDVHIKELPKNPT